ncbi:MAG TPA: phage portal protein, partial [Candidatus Saccharimonadales bacterium]|nr:phage portal protein [Candidatus Saccharimonadales bacterium]
SNEIGTGITPRSRAPDETFRKAADALWNDWTKVADADGVLDFYGLQSLASRTRVEGGEVFIRLRQRAPSDGLPVPLQLQFLEPEFCPSDTNELLPIGGHSIRAGIEFNGIGKRTAYWMHRTHPGERFLTINLAELVPVPASSVIHHYAPLRPGQLRGAPWTVQALIKTRDFDEYDDAELVRKKSRASYTAAITRANYADDEYKFDPFSGAPLDPQNGDVPIMTVEPGAMVAMLPGEDLKFFEGDSTGAGYADFVRQQLLGAAAALDIPYEFLSGDMSKVNDRLMRVVLNEFHRILEQSQWHLVIPQICEPVWSAWMDQAVLAGALTAPEYFARRKEYQRVDWRPQRWEYIHPVQDVQARQMEVASGFNSRSAVVAERGEDAEEIDRQNAEDKNRAEGLGLTYATHNLPPAPEQDDQGAAAA